MKSFFYTLIILLSFESLRSQSPNFVWAKQFGGTLATGTPDMGNSIKVDPSGNVYTVGDYAGNVDFDPGPSTYTLGNTIGNLFISKLDAAGNFVWAKQIGSGAGLYSKGFVFDAIGNIYVTGGFYGVGDFDPGPSSFILTSIGNFDAFVVKLDNSGNFIWAKQFGGGPATFAYAITVDNSYNVYTTGRFMDFADFDPGIGTYSFTTSSPVLSDCFISKLDATGNFVWAKQTLGSQYNWGNSICIDPFNNVCLTGFFSGSVDFDPGPSTYTLTSLGGYDVFVSKLDALGNFIFTRQLGGIGNEEGKSIKTNTIGDLIINGYFGATVDFDPGLSTFSMTAIAGNDVFVSKLDASGSFVWAKQIGGIGEDIPSDLALDANSNVYSIGYFESTADFDPGPSFFNLNTAPGSNPYRTDIFISKLDVNGNFSWAIQLGDTSFDEGHSIAVDINNYVYTTGFFRKDTTDFDPGIGTFTLCPIGEQDIFIHKMCQGCSLGINENISEKESVHIYPNPTNDIINLKLNEHFIGGSIQIFDAIGKLIQTQTIKTKNEKINLNLNSGIYFIKATTKEGVSKTEKLVIE